MFFFLFLIVGLCIGSFLNVVIYRIPIGLFNRDDHAMTPVFNIAWPPSHCFSCKNQIMKRDNIPVLSWLVLKGRCRHCGSAISSRYPFTELIVGVFFAVIGTWLVIFNNIDLLHTLPILFLFSILYCLVSIDFDHLILPDLLIYALLWCGLLFSVSGLSAISINEAVLGVIISWAFMTFFLKTFMVIRKREGMGAGDIKLYSALGAWVGWQNFPLLLVISSIIGLVIYKKLKKHLVNDIDSDNNIYHVIPFGPSISLAGLSIYIYMMWMDMAI